MINMFISIFLLSFLGSFTYLIGINVPREIYIDPCSFLTRGYMDEYTASWKPGTDEQSWRDQMVKFKTEIQSRNL